MGEFSRRDLKFSAGYQSIPGYPSDGFRADGALTNGRVLIALEVEVKQAHPDTNVGKYWLLSEHHTYEKVILIHVYTPGYNSYGWRKSLGEFYATKMKESLPFEYIQLDARKSTNYEETLDQVKELLAGKIRAEFSKELVNAA